MSRAVTSSLSIRPSDFSRRSRRLTPEECQSRRYYMPLARRGDLITRYFQPVCHVKGCLRCGSPDRKEVEMWMRRGFYGRDINRRAREQAVQELTAAGVTEVLTYGKLDPKRQKSVLSSLRRMAKGKLASIRDNDGRLTLMIRRCDREFVTQRLGEPSPQELLDGYSLERVLSRSPVKRLDGLLGRGLFHVAHVAQTATSCATTATSNDETVCGPSIRPSDFESDARDLGMHTRDELHRMGYRLSDDLQDSNIDARSTTVVPSGKEAATMTADQLQRAIASIHMALANLPDEVSKRVREELGKSEGEVERIRAERRRRATQ